jgi:hypothetical protein
MSNHPSQLPHEVRSPRGSSTTPTFSLTETKPPSEAAIAERAYTKYESRGRVHGFDLEDWTEASHEILTSASGHASNPSLRPLRNPTLAVVAPRE